MNAEGLREGCMYLLQHEMPFWFTVTKFPREGMCVYKRS